MILASNSRPSNLEYIFFETTAREIPDPLQAYTFACRELNALMNAWRFARVATRRSASLESRQWDTRVHRDTVARRVSQAAWQFKLLTTMRTT